MRQIARKPLPARTAKALAVATQRLKRALEVGAAPPITNAYKSRTIQRILRDEMFEHCCCFCEGSTEATGFGEVEHYRPWSLARFQKLAYAWENLLWACRRCNGLKSNAWDDTRPLLNPCEDDPSEHLTWADAVAVATTARAAYTIALLDLNGLSRHEKRRDLLNAIRLAWKAARMEGNPLASQARALLGALLGPRAQHRGMLAALGITAASIPQ